jgi:hypothetical protein
MNSFYTGTAVTELSDVNSIFSDGVAYYGGAIYCDMCQKLTLTGT